MPESTPGTRHLREVPSILQRLRLAAVACVATLAAACGGDGTAGGPQPQDCASCGTALVTITDAPGDFQSYTIDVTSLQLVRANGTVVETIPATTRIDFAELVDLGEVLAARQVPNGAYTAATLRVDYTNAEIVVEDEAGGSVEVQPVDALGQPVGQLELTVRLDGRNRLAIAPGRIAHLAFDLNLEASNTVDLAAGTVAVSPFIVASVVPPGERDWRVRGRLLDVDTAAGTYTVQVRPFHHHQQSSGELIVHTTAQTAFEIDAMPYLGAAGLAQLATLEDGATVIAFGTLDKSDFSFTAKRVLAGSSADDPERDYLTGHVLSRSGDTLLVAGVRLHWAGLFSGDGDADRRHGYFIHRPVTLLVGPGTRVTRAGQGGGALDASAISVGQRIQAFGDVSRDGTGALTLDASEGLVRLNHTRLAGMVTAADSGVLTLDLRSIGGYRPAQFDFTGTGLAPAQDADPDAYEVALAAGVNTAGLAAGSWTGLIGFVAPFGMAPPDFNAVTLVDHAATRASLGVSWVPGGAMEPFTALSAAGLVLDSAATPAPTGGIRLGGVAIALGQLAAPLAIAPESDDGSGTWAIAHRASASIENFSDFGEFSTALDAALDGEAALHKLVASGVFDAPSSRFDARQLLVVLDD